MTDLDDTINELLTADLVEPSPGDEVHAKCQWCGQEWTASRTVQCRHFSAGAGHCRDCGRQWSASRESHCAGCHRHFSSDSAFDAHQRLDHGPCDVGGEHGRTCQAISVCLNPKTLTKGDGSPRLVEVQTPDGLLWAWPGSRPPESIPERTSP